MPKRGRRRRKKIVFPQSLPEVAFCDRPDTIPTSLLPVKILERLGDLDARPEDGDISP